MGQAAQQNIALNEARLAAGSYVIPSRSLPGCSKLWAICVDNLLFNEVIKRAQAAEREGKVLEDQATLRSAHDRRGLVQKVSDRREGVWELHAIGGELDGVAGILSAERSRR